MVYVKCKKMTIKKERRHNFYHEHSKRVWDQSLPIKNLSTSTGFEWVAGAVFLVFISVIRANFMIFDVLDLLIKLCTFNYLKVFDLVFLLQKIYSQSKFLKL